MLPSELPDGEYAVRVNAREYYIGGAPDYLIWWDWFNRSSYYKKISIGDIQPPPEIDALIGTQDYPPFEESRLSDEERGVFNEITALPQSFEQAMSEDFNTAICLGQVFHTVRALNRFLPNQQLTRTDQGRALLAEARAVFARVGNVLGLFQVQPAKYLEMVKEKKLAQLDIAAEEIDRLVEERSQARKEKDWQRADEIRDMLLEKDIILEDGRGTTAWKVK